jgi:hypothetical protein
MAVIVSTTTPSALLTAIKDEMLKRSIETWAVDTDGDFTHTPPQWANKAWFRPTINTDRLVFSILTPKGVRMDRVTYAVYHGRFIEMLLTHFDLKFTQARASALPEAGDIVEFP